MNVSDLQWVYFVMEGQVVQRFHTRPGLTSYTDAQHSHGVAMICHRLTGGAPSVNLLMAALCHDLGEQYSSDVSSPAKRALGLEEKLKLVENEQLEKRGLLFLLTTEEARILALADQFEGMMYCCRERFVGNKYVDLMFNKWLSWSLASIKTPIEAALLSAIRSMWNRAISGDAPNFDVFI